MPPPPVRFQLTVHVSVNTDLNVNMAQIENLNPTTELEAVNAMLRAIGESPIAALGSGHPDETVAVSLLQEVVRETLTRRWRFNSEYNYAIDPDGVEGGRNVFLVPSGLASWHLAQNEDQRGLDVVAREERAGVPTDGDWIFADRINGTDGIAGLETLTIHPVWFVDWAMCPQSARAYMVVAAARRLQAQAVGLNQESPFGFSEQDESRAWEFFRADQVETIPVPPLESTAVTELEAVNQMLLAAGNDPLIDLTAIYDRAQYHALQVLRDTNREVQDEGWQFNSELSYELEPSDTYDWVDSAGETTTLNIFEPPTNLLSFSPSPTQGQVGSRHVDVHVRDSERYTPTASVFYDRVRNRDGLPESDHEFLYLDIIWRRDWSDLPEAARQYILMLATRRFLQAQPKPPKTLPWSEDDVRQARKTLVRKMGLVQPRNILNHPDAWAARGWRPSNNFLVTRDSHRR